MARITLTAVYETPLEDDVDAAVVARAFRLFNDEAAEVSRHPNAGVSVHFQIHRPIMEGRLCWSVSEAFDAEVSKRWDADRVAHTIASAAGRFEGVAATVISHSKMDILVHSLAKPMRKSLQASAPLEMTAKVPLRHDDRGFIGANPMAFVKVALECPYPFSTDLGQQLNGMTAKTEGPHLVISGASTRAVGFAAAAFVRAPRPIVLPVPRRSYWAYGTVAIMAASFMLSWLPLSIGAVIALGACAVAATLLALLFGHRYGLLRRTAIGLVPALIVVAFAIVYSSAGLSGHALELQGEPLHLRDTLLLSLSLTSTVGLLDLAVSGWLRSIAYLEMLLVAGYLGTAALVTVRSISVRLDQTIRELRFEREEG